MRKLFFITIVFVAVACGSSTNEEAVSDTTRTKETGNSAGSDIIGIDTMRMDTSSKSISPK